MKIFDETIETEAAPYVDFHGTSLQLHQVSYLIMLELSQLGVLPFHGGTNISNRRVRASSHTS